MSVGLRYSENIMIPCLTAHSHLNWVSFCSFQICLDQDSEQNFFWCSLHFGLWQLWDAFKAGCHLAEREMQQHLFILWKDLIGILRENVSILADLIGIWWPLYIYLDFKMEFGYKCIYASKNNIFEFGDEWIQVNWRWQNFLGFDLSE